MNLEQIPEKVHFIGVGGAGMSGLARILLELGYRVSGSDLNMTEITSRLESLGAVCHKGHQASHVDGAQMVVVSTAIRKDNPELVRALEKGITIVHRGDLLARLMAGKTGIAVAGAHGKTTTTSMLALVLEKNNLDPTILIGGELNDIGGNAKVGRGSYLLAEADESDGSFLKLEPKIEIITNVDNDHLDFYGTVERIKSAFVEFLKKVPEDGLAVVCFDDPGAREVVERYRGPLVSYSLGSGGTDYWMDDIYLNGMYSRAEVYRRGRHLGQLLMPVPGRHNLSNALAVIAVAMHIGLDFDSAAGALREFSGAGRRFQLMGEHDGVRVVDDYAHHPSEIRATLKAARQVGADRIIAVFQPHRYTRTSLLNEEFGTAFRDADLVVISEIYSAGEKAIEGINAGLIVDAVRKNGQEVIYLPVREEIVHYLAGMARPGDLILTMGAGNIWAAGVELLAMLKSGVRGQLNE